LDSGDLFSRDCGSLDARCGGGLWGAGQRLRSGAFAPDLPRRPPPSSSSLPPAAAAFRFPRAYRRLAPHRPPPHRALLNSSSRTLGRAACAGYSPAAGGGERSCGARSRPAARAAFGSVRGVLRRETSPQSARSAIANRKTLRKPQEAARAAGLGRAPQDTPPHPRACKNAKHATRPSVREDSDSTACRVGDSRCAGRR